MATSKARHPIHSFDVDKYINPIVPRPRFHILPTPISHWFGYRPPREEHAFIKPQPKSVLLTWMFSFLGAFIGISIIENVFLRLPHLDGVPVPIVVASFGAAAILEYNAIESPLSQPRNLLLGHCLSAAVGVAITKLFLMLPHDRFLDLQWLAGALSVAAASTIMSMTKTVHPPAGATALLAATSQPVMEVGWWLILLVLLAGMLMLTSAMLVNNIYSRFPVYWWTPANLADLKKSKITHPSDTENGKAETSSSSDSNSETETKKSTDEQTRKASDVPVVEHDERPLDKSEQQKRNIHNAAEKKVVIELDRIVVPDWMNLSSWEAQVLQEFQRRLRE